jgi:DNA-directed RNA polymerase subunit RPC12/RpoP
MMFTYRCEICDEKFESTITLDQAVQQYQQRFPGALLNDQTQIACDDCFFLLMGAGAALRE